MFESAFPKLKKNKIKVSCLNVVFKREKLYYVDFEMLSVSLGV